MLPANSTLTSGAGTFSITLKTAGSQTLTTTDTVNATITGTSNTIDVSPGSAAHFVVSGLADPSAPGDSQDVTVTAKDPFDNTATGYAGAVHFTSDDGLATLPADYTFTGGDNGSHTFADGVTLKSADLRKVIATDTSDGTITGTQTVTVDDTLYVATTGSDANAGSQAAPLKTIKAAVTKTGSLPGVLKIHVQQGTYNEGSGGVAVVDGLTISGGYAADWTQAGTATTIIGDVQSVLADSDTGVSLDHVTLAPTRVSGPSVYGVRAINGSSVALSDVEITTPNAGVGSQGVPPGTIGLDGGNGSGGENGSSDCTQADGGAGATFNATGGAGGGANCSGSGTGGSGENGGFGGSAGGCCSGSNGGSGGFGGNGFDGNLGFAGANFTDQAGTTWLGRSGGLGQTGADGGGGGGGGGGGRFRCSLYPLACGTDMGGAGGGGGGGGTAGTGGAGGDPGGGSFGVYLWQSSASLTNVHVTVGKGGDGGAGGPGGLGGLGGHGASGGVGFDDGGHGGNGGDGGRGGDGGSGGGGAGGPSIGLFRGNSTATTVGFTATLGGGGLGGFPNGQTGLAMTISS